jgi:hypothetical protein
VVLLQNLFDELWVKSDEKFIMNSHGNRNAEFLSIDLYSTAQHSTKAMMA